jgi:GxxExxY protein
MNDKIISASTRELDDITGMIIDDSIRIHRELGPGLLESVYEVVLAKSLERRGFKVERQKSVSFEYNGMSFDEGFRVDLLVEQCVVSERKLALILDRESIKWFKPAKQDRSRRFARAS